MKITKKKFYILGLGLSLALAFIAGSVLPVLSLKGATPGSPEDPLVSRSYVDMRLNELSLLIQQTNEANNQSSAMLNLETVTNEVLAAIVGFYGETDVSFTPVFVPAGSTVFAGEGVEIILRSGTAAAFVPGQDGIVNATAGRDIFNDENIPANNLLIVPREDGRGVRANTDAWFIIRGEFEIKR